MPTTLWFSKYSDSAGNYWLYQALSEGYLFCIKAWWIQETWKLDGGILWPLIMTCKRAGNSSNGTENVDRCIKKVQHIIFTMQVYDNFILAHYSPSTEIIVHILTKDSTYHWKVLLCINSMVCSSKICILQVTWYCTQSVNAPVVVFSSSRTEEWMREVSDCPKF
jgi:hypothetical protein